MHVAARLTVAVIACVGAFALPARAQIASVPPSAQSAAGWTFAVTPYAWLPTISTTLNFPAPRGGVVTSSGSSGVSDYLSQLNFALMIGGEARYDRFTVMTDLVYANASVTTSNTHFSKFNPGPGPIDIPREQQLSTGTRMATTVWSLAGGYTVLQGAWGNVDVLAGMRLLAIDSTTNYALSADVLLPNRTIGLARNGSLSVSPTLVDGVGGITGRINIPNSKFYLPYYFDVGGGGVPLTWQAYGAIAYSAASWFDVSLGYRYVAFQDNGNSSKGVSKLNLGGPILAANFRF